jgi:flagellar assembly protein FliH
MSAKSGLTAWERWELASFDEVLPAAAGAAATAAMAPADAVPPAPTFSAEEIVALREQVRADAFTEGREAGHREGYEAGYTEGKLKGEADAEALGRTQAEHLASAVKRLETQIDALDDSVADELLAMALEVARKLVQQVHDVRPEVIVDVIREALGHMPVQHSAIHLNPDDASLARLYAGEQLAHAGHRIHENASLARGDVMLEAGGSHLDATLSSRWRRVVETLGNDTPWIGESLPITPDDAATGIKEPPAEAAADSGEPE